MAEKQHINNSITFIDTEIEPNSRRVLDLGAIKNSGTVFHNTSMSQFKQFLRGTQYICGHNILKHDLQYIENDLIDAEINTSNVIDTLFLSPLLFPTNPYHSLLKDDKLQTNEISNPLNDSIKAKDLFYDELSAFSNLDETLKEIFYLLLNEQKEFEAFFRYISYFYSGPGLVQLIRQKFKNEICERVNLNEIIKDNPIELAYSLSLTNSFIQHKKTHSITPAWVLINYPKVEHIMFRLRNEPCIMGCNYCNDIFNPNRGLKRIFGYDSFRTFDGEPLQEQAVKSALDNQSLLAVFPTGGGKSLTFQLPALMSGETSRALTIVISPLQSLMKDQVDNLEKIGITDAVTINGLLDPIERAKSVERVSDGSATILYIAPESLRSKTIERLVLGRNIARFVIDEAHCFSTWGQDFRVDYLYIGDFINKIQEKKKLKESIPVSCFTATAKQQVIENIRQYFKQKLALDLELFTSKASRTNLQYKVFEKSDEEEKYLAVRDLIVEKNCPTIIYVSRTRKAFRLAERLSHDGFNAKPYHGKMDKQEKSENQDSFISSETQIMVATSAFGMGVDKSDVGMVIHYEISDSLENYVQEAGRAGRDENIIADCFVLFDEEDLSKHFILLNQTKLSIKEIQQIWRAIKDITRFRSTVSNSALEIARKAGWDDNVVEIETRVITAIAALEDAGYLKRGQNMPRIFANSILSKNVQEAIEKINASERFQENKKVNAVRIIKKLFSTKSRKHANDEVAEARVDYISDHLGIVKKEVINIVNLLREERILADAKDLTAFIKKGDNIVTSLNLVDTFSKIENFLVNIFNEEEKIYHLKELNEEAEQKGIPRVNTQRIKTTINFWAIKNWIKRKTLDSRNHIGIVTLHSEQTLKSRLEKRHALAKFIIEYLFEKSEIESDQSEKEEVLIEFSVHELKKAYDESMDMFKLDISIDDVEDTLFYLSRIEALKIEGGFLVIYNQLTIERKETNNLKRYTTEDYEKLNQFYENKVQQIHIVGEYAKMMVEDYKKALQFVEDYFQLDYTEFLNKYFKGGRKKEINQNITPAKFKQLFGELSPTQLKIINDNEAKNIVVTAGPGSGKTRVLVHKLASLLLMEDVKHEQLLMLTFSRAAAAEFKMRLLQLIGNAAHFIEIKTFHSYCFDLLGRVGSLEKSEQIIKKTIEKIQNNEVEINQITKTVLVIDEAQDMDENEFGLIAALMDKNEEMRVIAVGDDDQNIYEFRGSSSKHLEKFIFADDAVKYDLLENYRSKSNLVHFSNQFVERISYRLKQTPNIAKQPENGKIKIIQHRGRNLITPLVNDIKSNELVGTTCVLTRTNEEALQITGLLLKKGIQAKLIQSNDGFSLYNLNEVRFFLSQLNLTDDIYVINDNTWNRAKHTLKSTFQNSNKLEIVENIINDFEETNPYKKYKSDLEVFIRESRLEDFYNNDGQTIFVSTIHKAKGKEFDNVYIMLRDHDVSTDSAKRLLYVAMTRAKSNLRIHLNASYLNNINAENLTRLEDTENHQQPNELAMHPSLRDVWLDYFIRRQHLINKLKSGDNLIVKDDGCYDNQGKPILKFSRSFAERVENLKSRNYQIDKAVVNFILYWQGEEMENEIKVVLPELFFKRVE